MAAATAIPTAPRKAAFISNPFFFAALVCKLALPELVLDPDAPVCAAPAFAAGTTVMDVTVLWDPFANVVL